MLENLPSIRYAGNATVSPRVEIARGKAVAVTTYNALLGFLENDHMAVRDGNRIMLMYVGRYVGGQA